MPEIMRDIKQLSLEWFSIRCGSIGGSSIKAVMTGGKGKTRKTLMYQLASEILTGEKYQFNSTPAMDEGVRREAESRSKFSLITGLDIEEVGLIKGDVEGTHISPDALTSDGASLELKNPMAHTQVKYVDEDRLPPEYIKQVMYSMWITGHKHEWFFSYCPKIKPLLIKVYRDEEQIKAIETETIKFLAELNCMVKNLAKKYK